MSERNVLGVAGTWTELTENDVASLRVQNQSGYTLFVKRGTSTAPSSTEGSISLKPYDIFFEAINDLWPGSNGGRVWGFSKNAINASVSHE